MRGWTAIPLSAALLVLAAPAAAKTLEGGFDLAEIHLEDDHNIFLDGTLSYGSKRDKVVAKLTVDGSLRRLAGIIDGQLLYSRGIGGSFAVLAGIRHEFRPPPHLTYAMLGIEGEPMKGLSVESYFYLSEKGDVTGELKSIYDLPLSKRWTLQPRAVLGYAVQSVAAQGLASGPSKIEVGARLRYELAGVFAPYIGISHEQLLGGTVKFARAAGDDVRAVHFVVGFSSAF